jgi:glycerol-3-phosphate dehydrogenase
VPGVPEESYGHLACRYGHAAEQVLALAEQDPGLSEPILAGHPDLLAEAAYAARQEQARTIGDVLMRRTRLWLLDGPALGSGSEAPERVARVIGRELGWSGGRLGDEVERFAEEAQAEGVAAVS